MHIDYPHRLLGAIVLLTAVVVGCPAGADDGFRSVTGPCDLDFPADHGPHPAYRTEWWYYTGNLATADNRRFGFQLTFFRRGLQPPEKRRDWPDTPSAWRSDQIFLAHAAVTDIDGRRHLLAERMARPALGMAGADITGSSVRVYTHAWQVVIRPEIHRLDAHDNDFTLRLDLTPTKPPVLHGDKGYSRKGQSPERASCYYSFTRLEAVGRLTVAGQDHAVQGSAWMDHEYSTAPLQPGISGWDWFSLQLDDRTEVMFFVLRQAEGAINPASSGTLVLPSGRTRHLAAGDMSITPRSHWTSPHSGARYPVAWQLRIPDLPLDLEVRANLTDQEMHTPRSTNVTYWEGSVSVTGTRSGVGVSGVGYVEMTGYARPFDAPM